MKEVPVKIEHNNQWVVVKLGVGEDRIVFPAPVKRKSFSRTLPMLLSVRISSSSRQRRAA